ncbi:MAG: Hsp70 family protein [Immundisolibacter sp.]|uniref:Hsp70 family protein n=1 Tax=Immundisolibacter sp. TaxID=1934948 RepID=UPI003D10B0BC
MIIGIDLGTTHSAIAVQGQATLTPGFDGTYLPCDVTAIPTPYGERTVPSVLWVDPDDATKVLVGIDAVQKAEDGVSPIMFSKRSIGSDELLAIHGHRLTATQVATHILAHLKQIAEQALGEPVYRAVITHPAYFTPAQVEQTRQAAVDAGFDMSLPEQMLMEPAAAALAYLHGDARDPLTVLTYDLGGGTFDVTILERRQGVTSLKAFEGDHLLGGYNFDRRLVEWIVRKAEAGGRKVAHDPDNPQDRGLWARLMLLAENVKLRLSEQHTAQVPVPVRVQNLLVDTQGRPFQLNERITRAEFTALIADHLETTVECCRRAIAKAGITAADLDLILMVGGSTYGPWVGEALQAAFDGVPVESFEQDLSVAAGAAIRAGALPRTPPAGKGIRVMLDVPTKWSLESIDIVGSVAADDGQRLDEALRGRLRVLLTTPDRGTMPAQMLAGDGGFRFAEVELDLDEPTEFRLVIADDQGLERFSTRFQVAYGEDVGGGAQIYRSLPRQLSVKTAEGLVPLAQEGAQLPAQVDITLRRLHADASLSVPIYMEEIDVGAVRVNDLPTDSGEGGTVTLDLTVTEEGQIKGSAKVATRGGEVIATQRVRITFPPMVIPSLNELREKYDELEAQRAQDAATAQDRVRRLALTGAVRNLGAQIATLFEELQPDRQEIHARLREFERSVHPPADDMSPTRAVFVERAESCRASIAKLDNHPSARHFSGQLDQILRDGEAAYADRNRRRWAQVNHNLEALIQRLPKESGGPAPELPVTPLLKDMFRHDVDRQRELLDGERDRHAQHPDYDGVFASRYDALDGALLRMEKDIDEVSDDLPPPQGLARLQLATRGLDQMPRRIRDVVSDVGSAVKGRGGP